MNLQDTVLDDATVDQLFFDIAQAAEVLAVVVKGDVHQNASQADLSLDDARSALREGRVVGVQIRYRLRGTEWWDTLMHVPTGIRLVRMEQRWE